MRRFCRTFLLISMILTAGMRAFAEAPALLEPVGVQSDTAVVARSDIFNITVFDGEVVPHVEEMYFTVDGTVGEVHVRLGEPIKAGESIITLDQTNLFEQIEALSEEIAYIEADLAFQNEIANIDIRMKGLALQQLIGAPVETEDEQARLVEIELMQLDIERMRMENAHYNQRVNQLELDAKRVELSRLNSILPLNTLVAPYDGHIVFGRQMKKGDYVGAYEPLIYIADNTRLQVKCDYVSEPMTRTASKIYALIGDHEYLLEYIPMDQSEFLSAMLSGISLTSEFDIAEPEKAGDIEAGMFAAVCTVTGLREDTLVIPSNALFREFSGGYVYVMEDGARTRRDIKTGMVTDGLTEVVSGLSEGEVVYVKD